MDDIVRAALKKWPNVPDVRGWLGLDARGDWWLRDERAQAAGAFPQVKGSRIEHEGLVAFIGRNYEHDDAGCWFFQNGPQRVYVELEAAPWVWRVHGDAQAPRLESHTGAAARFESAWVDDAERLFLAADLGLGLVHTLDMDAAADAVEAATWQPQRIAYADLLRRFGVQPHPSGHRARA